MIRRPGGQAKKRSLWQCLILGAMVGLVPNLVVGHTGRAWVEIAAAIVVVLGAAALLGLVVRRQGRRRAVAEVTNHAAAPQLAPEPLPAAREEAPAERLVAHAGR